MTVVPAYSEKPAGEFTYNPVANNAYNNDRQPPAYTNINEVEPNLNPTEDELPRSEKGTGKTTMRQRLHKMALLPGKPLNKASNIIGAEGWWPANLEQESLKAARTLYSFTNLDATLRPAKGPKHPIGVSRKALVKIPRQVLDKCAGLAIFNTLRAGMWHGSLSGGSGVVVARREDGSWSPPSAFAVTTVGAGFMLGLDCYDCVCVLNTPAQVAAFTRPQLSLGGGLSMSMGPVGGGAALNAALNKPARPAWSYIKSRGLWAGVQVDGTIIVSRADANAAFYGEKGITAQRILQGDVAWPAASRPLFEVLMALEGRRSIVPEEVVSDQVYDAPAYAPPPHPDAKGGDNRDGYYMAPAGVPAPPMPAAPVDEKQAAVPDVRVVDADAPVDEKVPPYSDARDREDDELYADSVADEKKMLSKSEQ